MPAGGLARRATYLNNFNRNNNDALISVDAGDFVGGRGELFKQKTEVMLQAFSMLNYTANNLGEKDFINGPEFLLDMSAKYSAPIISASVYYLNSGELFTRPYLIRSVPIGGKLPLKIGIFGIIMQTDSLCTHSENGILAARDPIETSRNMISVLRDSCDLIVMLSHLGLYHTKNLVKRVPGIDVVVSGHGYAYQKKALRIGETIIVHGRIKGQCAERLELVLNSHNKIASQQKNSVLLDKSFSDEPKIRTLLDNFHKNAK